MQVTQVSLGNNCGTTQNNRRQIGESENGPEEILYGVSGKLFSQYPGGF